jgi:hypothetical protein
MRKIHPVVLRMTNGREFIISLFFSLWGQRKRAQLANIWTQAKNANILVSPPKGFRFAFWDC